MLAWEVQYSTVEDLPGFDAVRLRPSEERPSPPDLEGLAEVDAVTAMLGEMAKPFHKQRMLHLQRKC